MRFSVGVVPALIVITTYFVSALNGHVGWCCPVLDGCTSISATGRYGVSYYIFKAGMLPMSALLAVFWWLSREWLLSSGAEESVATRAMVTLGCASAVFLVLYAVFLGSDGDVYRLLRRYGVNLHFGLQFLAQALLAGQLLSMSRRLPVPMPSWLAPALLSVLGLMLLIGLASIPLANVMSNRNQPQNMAAWSVALLVTAYYLLIWVAWWRSRITLRVELAG